MGYLTRTSLIVFLGAVVWLAGACSDGGGRPTTAAWAVDFCRTVAELDDSLERVGSFEGVRDAFAVAHDSLTDQTPSAEADDYHSAVERAAESLLETLDDLVKRAADGESTSALANEGRVAAAAYDATTLQAALNMPAGPRAAVDAAPGCFPDA